MSQVVVLYQILNKTLTLFFRTKLQSIFSPILVVVLYFLVFGNVLGNRIGNVLGVSYIEFLIPGIIIMNIIVTAFSSCSFFIFGEKHHKCFEEILVSSAKTSTIILSVVLYGFLRSFFIGIIIYFVSLFFLPIIFFDIFLVFALLFFTIIFFSLLGILLGLFSRTFEQLNIFGSFVLTPLNYIGGVFFPISLLSGFWQTFSLFNPLSYIIQTFRYGFLGVESSYISITFSILIVFSSIFYFLCYYLIEKRIRTKI